MKRRELCRSTTNVVSDYSLEVPEPLMPSNTMSIGTQTELTADDIKTLEAVLQSRTEEVADLKKALSKGYPKIEDFRGSEKLIRLYTGLSTFTVLMAVFNLVSSAISRSSLSKLDNFAYFTMVLMELRFHANNADLAFRFGISKATISRVFLKWIRVMDVRLKFLIMWPERELI